MPFIDVSLHFCCLSTDLSLHFCNYSTLLVHDTGPDRLQRHRPGRRPFAVRPRKPLLWPRPCAPTQTIMLAYPCAAPDAAGADGAAMQASVNTAVQWMPRWLARGFSRNL